jgi:hypothetical protein
MDLACDVSKLRTRIWQVTRNCLRHISARRHPNRLKRIVMLYEQKDGTSGSTASDPLREEVRLLRTKRPVRLLVIAIDEEVGGVEPYLRFWISVDIRCYVAVRLLSVGNKCLCSDW